MNEPIKPEQRPRRDRREVRSKLREAAYTLAYVLGAMLVVTAVLVVALPPGTRPADLYGDWRSRTGGGDRVDRRGAGAPADPSDTEDEAVARLVHVVRTVKDRPAQAVAWNVARSGMPLSDEHAIQTAPRSSATVAFGDASTLELGEKSLVVVRRPTKAQGGPARPSLVVLGGRVHGRGARASAPVAITTPTGELELRAAEDQPAEYSVTVAPDRTTTLTLLSGTAEVTSAGERAELRPNESITLKPGMRPEGVVRVPDPPRPSVPADGAVVTYGATPPLLRFEWDPVPGSRDYRLTIARDAQFAEPFHEAVVDGTTTTHGGLEAGCYHWRVQARAGAAESEPGPAARLCIERDAVPPTLRVELPSTPVSADHFELRGSTEPGASVLVGAQRLTVAAAGEFVYTLALRRGPNLVVVEAVDAAGNVSYQSGYVHAKF